MIFLKLPSQLAVEPGQKTLRHNVSGENFLSYDEKKDWSTLACVVDKRRCHNAPTAQSFCSAKKERRTDSKEEEGIESMETTFVQSYLQKVHQKCHRRDQNSMSRRELENAAVASGR
jgi:hypothetical protein